MKKNFFLDHPVFSIVISIVITIVGGIGLTMLPVDQYPDIVPPVVSISASYPGAASIKNRPPIKLTALNPHILPNIPPAARVFTS